MGQWGSPMQTTRFMLATHFPHHAGRFFQLKLHRRAAGCPTAAG
jgi:hypothetical protein